MVGTVPAITPAALDVAARKRRDRTEQGPVLRTPRTLEGRMSGDIRPSLFSARSFRDFGDQRRCAGGGKVVPATAGVTEQGGSGGPHRSPAVTSLLASNSGVTHLVRCGPTSGHSVTHITFIRRRKNGPSHRGSHGPCANRRHHRCACAASARRSKVARAAGRTSSASAWASAAGARAAAHRHRHPAQSARRAVGLRRHQSRIRVQSIRSVDAREQAGAPSISSDQ